MSLGRSSANSDSGSQAASGTTDRSVPAAHSSAQAPQPQISYSGFNISGSGNVQVGNSTHTTIHNYPTASANAPAPGLPRFLPGGGGDNAWMVTSCERLKELEWSLRKSILDAEETPETVREKLHDSCEQLGDQKLREGHSTDASDLYHEAFEVIKKGRDENDVRVIEARDELAMDLARLGFHSEAAEQFQASSRAYSRRESNGEYSEKALASKHGHAMCLAQLDKEGLQHADRLFKENLLAYKGLSERHRSSEWDQMIQNTNKELAFVCSKLGKWEEARRLNQSVLDAMLKASDQVESTGSLNVRRNLGRNLYQLGKYQKARDLFSSNLSHARLLDEVNVSNHWDWIRACETYGELEPYPENFSDEESPKIDHDSPIVPEAIQASGTLSRVSTLDPVSPLFSRQSTMEDENQSATAEADSYYGYLYSSNDVHRIDGWFRKLRRTHQLLFRPQAKKAIPALKIAILDTGIDGNLELFQSMKKIMAWRDWTVGAKEETKLGQVSGRMIQQTCTDVDGHGTHLAALLLEVNPMAEIYVARIASKRDKSINPTHVAEVSLSCYIQHQVLTLKKAIAFATDNWKVDIITMSLGFQGQLPFKYREALENSILRANRKGILMFAAGANEGSTERTRAYPADDENVICVGAANGPGDPYTGNPPQRVNSRYYTTLGVEVRSACLMSEWHEAPEIGAGLASGDSSKKLQEPAIIKTKKRTGCSVATAILAACASLILEFIRQERAASQPQKAETMRIAEIYLKKPRFMRSIFEEISDSEGPTKGYVVPWKLLDSQKLGAREPREYAHHLILSKLEKEGCSF
ncbi:hypothetical protein FH972_026350 [Carpinus fangiana]|uniref:Peptidase S8/S53 domain-containing protein n=1 Tax=Carpinus fangiana TaxID=176857 RepID=A0A5N6L4P7_9ROSI|nr:hypothetical protein FH972_026350 [Carpinus fangiana]